MQTNRIITLALITMASSVQVMLTAQSLNSISTENPNNTLVNTSPENQKNGIIRGRIIDGSNAKKIQNAEIELISATNANIEGSESDRAAIPSPEKPIKTTSDLDGKFEIQAAPGSYSLRITAEGYNAISITDITINSNETNPIGDIKLESAVEGMEEVKISVKSVKNNEEALLTAKKIAPNMIDGISAANFKRIGDGDAASAMSRVTGVSVEGGKYVFVRGLGDRYTKTTLNGVDIPGLDPDRNTIQMDLFPTNVIDNIVVSKTFTADLPADFTGGVVDISTKDFPEKKNWSVNFGLGYNPNMNLKSNYLTYQGSSTDFLGFDNGSRDIPTDNSSQIPSYTDFLINPNGTKGKEFQEITRKFNPTMGAEQKTSFLNLSMGISYANQKKLNKKYTLGYQASLTYKNETEFYEGAEFNLYAKDPNPENMELTALERQTGNYGTNNVLLGALGGIALKSTNDKYRFNILHIQNGESKAGQFYFRNTNLGANWEANQNNLEYNQRSLTNILIAGTHSRNKGKTKIDWKIAPTRSNISDPDIRFTRFRDPDNVISTEVGKPERIWRDLTEYNVANRLDVSKEVRVLGKKGKLGMGLAYTYKNRSFDIRNFQVTVGDTKFSGDPNEIFNESNLVSASNKNGVRYDAMFIKNGQVVNPNKFQSQVHYSAAYATQEVQISPLLKTVVGLRAEQYTQLYTGINQLKTIDYQNEKVINNVNLFPTANAMYNISKNANIRISYARTIARPSLKEMSYAEILDPITGRTFIGGKAVETTNGGKDTLWNGDLRSTHINNFDIRWESFQKSGNMISAGVFYKTLKDPIEIVQFLADAGSFQPRNVGNATILGAEFELRQQLSIISDFLKQWSFNTNLTITESRINITESEYLSRKNSARSGQIIDRNRAMAGQAPYIINGGLSYTNKKKTLDAGLFYNVQGPTLQFVGFSNNTDVYSVPFHSLNFNANIKFGPQNKMDLGVKVSNLLNDKREQIFSSFNAQDQYFTRLNPGTNISVKFSYSL